jgi:hypothetical protein
LLNHAVFIMIFGLILRILLGHLQLLLLLHKSSFCLLPNVLQIICYSYFLIIKLLLYELLFSFHSTLILHILIMLLLLLH